ncbi:unnamed protein product [Porites lobata]|uniref:Uncharacterized protein n=1 Tax=Porites lobata TaxID=104759 RepID=A0ABN8SHM3_9CNID|nr:unnamed protein product [Porites lobata]
MKEATKALKDSKTVQEDEIQELRALLTKTKAELKEERDKVIEQEDYTRQEDLKFHNIPESEEDVHRIGKRKENKHRPIIARFVCGEDREQVLPGRRGLKRAQGSRTLT